jgi:hypothetical protein
MRQSLGKVVLVLLMGALIGAVFSQVIGLFLNPDSVAYQVFVKGYEGFPIPELTLDLVVIRLTFGLTIKVTLMSVVGVFVASQMLRWYRY